MYDQINEIIEVFVNFKKDNIVPKFFIWRRKMYKIGKVHLVHISKNGSQILYHFSVTDDCNLNYFQLAFNTCTLTWILEILYYSG